MNPTKEMMSSASPFAIPAVCPPHGLLSRRSLTMGLLAGAVPGFMGGAQSATAARRAPPPPPTVTERKDPNMSALQSKILAGKKRKEAMKEFIAKEKAKGNLIISQPTLPPQ